MGYVNEFIPADDIKKYSIEEIDSKFVGGSRSRQWTIDRERNSYLRNVSRGGGSDPDLRNQTTWTFFWQGELITLQLDLLEASGDPGEPGWSHWLLVRANGSNGLPNHLRSQGIEFLDDLKQALTAYKDLGVYSSNTGYEVTLDVDKDCAL